MGRPKGAKNKPKGVKGENELETAINTLMQATDPKDKAAGVRLKMAYDKLYGKKNVTAVNPTVLAFYELIMKLETELRVKGETIIANLNEQISDVEQLVQRNMSEVWDGDGDNAI